jgi:hypothetical protein
MSYAVASALQGAVYQALSSDEALGGLVGDAIYDAVPSGKLPDLHVNLGPETVKDASDKSGHGADHRFTVSVVSAAPGFANAKAVAAAICDVLVDADLPLDRGRLVSLSFDRATARRVDNDTGRRIDLRFRARVEDN